MTPPQLTDYIDDDDTDNTNTPSDNPADTNTAIIPPQLADYPLVRVCRPDCQSHENCNSNGKRPVTAADDPDSNTRVTSWFNRGGNYGVVPTAANDLVIFDVDSAEMATVLERKLPQTFIVTSGGDDFGEHWYYRCGEVTDQRNWTRPEGGVRTTNWMSVAPGSTHGDTGAQYEIRTDVDIATITPDRYHVVYNILDTINRSATNTTPTVENSPSETGDGCRHTSVTSPSIPDSLAFIRSHSYRQKIAAILQDPTAPHDDRLWLAGWLYSAGGLRPGEIIDLIHQECCWGDYNPAITEDQVESIPRSSDSERGTHPSANGFTTAEFDFLRPDDS